MKKNTEDLFSITCNNFVLLYNNKSTFLFFSPWFYLTYHIFTFELFILFFSIKIYKDLFDIFII